MNLLTTRYDDLDIAMRAEAIHLAYQQGRDAAQADTEAASGVDTREGGAREYFHYVVEPVYASEDCSEDEYTFFETAMIEAENEADPRIEAFARGWLAKILDVEQELAIDKL